jgi:hypothetical protein
VGCEESAIMRTSTLAFGSGARGARGLSTLELLLVLAVAGGAAVVQKPAQTERGDGTRPPAAVPQKEPERIESATAAPPAPEKAPERAAAGYAHCVAQGLGLAAPGEPRAAGVRLKAATGGQRACPPWQLRLARS